MTQPNKPGPSWEKEAAEKYAREKYPGLKYPEGSGWAIVQSSVNDFLAGARWAQEKAAELRKGVK